MERGSTVTCIEKELARPSLLPIGPSQLYSPSDTGRHNPFIPQANWTIQPAVLFAPVFVLESVRGAEAFHRIAPIWPVMRTTLSALFAVRYGGWWRRDIFCKQIVGLLRALQTSVGHVLPAATFVARASDNLQGSVFLNVGLVWSLLQAGYLLQVPAPVQCIEYTVATKGEAAGPVCLVKASHIANSLLGERSEAARSGFMEQLKRVCCRVCTPLPSLPLRPAHTFSRIHARKHINAVCQGSR